VGAGPGDPDLLTVGARQALRRADLVVADRLIPLPILDMVRCELRTARKFVGRANAAQAELEGWVMDAARQGRTVVRLKCGDPFLFGRGQEEVVRFEAAGLPVRLLPGVSSALAAPAAAGIAVTCRGVADRVLVLTGHGADGREVEIPQPRSQTTQVWLMAMGRLSRIVEQLLSKGADPCTPAAIITRAGHAEQRAVRAPLQDLVQLRNARQLGAPAVVVIGAAVALAPSLAFEADLCRPAVRVSPRRAG
jgi:uroporphyrin-III C-methyltransferase